jgi:enoyl-CoA hydratase
MGFEFSTLSVEQVSQFWKIVINRPQALNALNSQVLNELAEALRMISEQPFENARGLVITGSGEKAFVAGADIKEISALTQEQALQFAVKGQSVFHELSIMKIPVIAAVNGFALGGGCELALSADFIFASENAKFGLPEVSLGLIPGFGGTIRLARAIGQRKANELTFTGNMLSAQEALALGLVNTVLPQAELINHSFKVLEKISLQAPLAVSAAKKSILANWDLDIDEAQKYEAREFANLFSTADVVEGTKAFIEKRKPSFRGE